MKCATVKMRRIDQLAEVMADDSVYCGRNSLIGIPSEESIGKLRDATSPVDLHSVTLGSRTIIGNFVAITEGVHIGHECMVEDYVQVGLCSKIGDRCRLCYSAIVCDAVTIGDDCIVGGFVCDDATIGNGSRTFGLLLHAQSTPQKGWWDVTEPAPTIGTNCVIGMGSVVVGSVEIGSFSYVVAGAVITKCVPAKSIVYGTNTICAIDEWRGSKLHGWIKWVRQNA